MKEQEEGKPKAKIEDLPESEAATIKKRPRRLRFAGSPIIWRIAKQPHRTRTKVAAVATEERRSVQY